MNDDHMTPEDRDTLRALGRALPQVAPPPGLGDRIAAAVVAEEPRAQVIPIEQARSWRRRTVVASLAAAACAAALAVGITLSVTGPSQPDAPLTASTAVVATQAVDKVTGTASLYGADGPGGQVQVSLRDVPAPPPGHHYEVWVLEKGSDQMTSVGTFTPAAKDVDLTLPLPAPADYAAVDISVEPNGGAPAHSGTSLAGGKFSA
jgi:anti-sigma-K factor RskA